MRPFAPNARIFSSGIVHGWISQYTFSSRTRRAMSWVYCDPKSRIRIFSSTLSLEVVVRRFLRDDDVVHVALAEPGRRDPHELRLRLQLGDVRAPGVAHAGAQAAEELVDRRRDRSAIRHAPLDALGHELLDLASTLLDAPLDRVLVLRSEEHTSEL